MTSRSTYNHTMKTKKRMMRFCRVRRRVVLSVGLALASSSCSGPQPLSVAIDPADQKTYVERLNRVNHDGRKAFVDWMAAERKQSPEAVLAADARLSTTRNPFDAHADARAVSRGAVIYKFHCLRCHGEDASGGGPAMSPEHPTIDFHAFGQRFASTIHRGAPRAWFRKINEGFGEEVDYPDERTRAMPAFGKKLTREQIWLVITYLQSLDIHARNQ